VPTARIVATPSDDTEHAEFVVPAPSVYVTVNPDDVVAPIDTLAEPNDALDG